MFLPQRPSARRVSLMQCKASLGHGRPVLPALPPQRPTFPCELPRLAGVLEGKSNAGTAGWGPFVCPAYRQLLPPQGPEAGTTPTPERFSLSRVHASSGRSQRRAPCRGHHEGGRLLTSVGVRGRCLSRQAWQCGQETPVVVCLGCLGPQWDTCC